MSEGQILLGYKPGDDLDKVLLESVEISFSRGGGMVLKNVLFGDLKEKIRDALDKMNDAH